LSTFSKYSPNTLKLAEGGLKAIPQKAYRWVEGMRRIGSTFATEGGLDAGEAIFDGVAEGKKQEEGGGCGGVYEGVKRRKEKGEKGEKGEGDLAWSSWS
jgi:hypothetical protein